MEYLLEHQEEVERLERQSRQQNYSIQKELQSLQIKSDAAILDAGCGSGLISRHLVDKFPSAIVKACDASASRVAQAKVVSGQGKYSHIDFFHSNLENVPLSDNSMDAIVCRFVYEYLPNPQVVTNEFFRILKPGGTVFLIDLDGIFLNYWTTNPRLNNYIEMLRRGLSVDLFVGRKLSSYLVQAGFNNIHQEASIHTFNDCHDLEEEYVNNKYRLAFGREVFSEVLGGNKEFLEFQDLYLDEMRKPTSNFFFNKFVSFGTKDK